MSKKPNILFITSDQQHWNTIGKFNNEIKTPNLDRLVNEGTYFDRAYTVNPTCTPTRATLITGKYPSQHGAWSLGTKLPEDEVTIGQCLQEEGYRTALVGKAHFQQKLSTDEYPSLESSPLLHDLDFWRNFNEDFYGFDHCELARNHTNEYLVGQHYAIWMEEKGCNNWRDYFTAPTGTMDESIEHKWSIPEEYHYDTWIAERTNALLEQYKEHDENFFLWASFFDPHPPYLVSEPWDTMYDPEKLTIPKVTPGEHDNSPYPIRLTQEDPKNNPDFWQFAENGIGIHGLTEPHIVDEEKLKKNIAVYYGMMSMMDKYIGKILDKLEELGLAENTIVVYTTDHGHFYGHHGLIKKGPFLYEDLIKVPFIVRYPNKVPANNINSSMQSLVDVVPTFLNLTNTNVPRTMSGLNQLPVWFGEKEKVRDHIICENRQSQTKVHMRTYVDERYKLTVYYNRLWGELYDLQEDPGEINNLWDNEDFIKLKSELLLKYAWAELGKETTWMPRVTDA